MAFLEGKPGEFREGAYQISAEALNTLLKNQARQVRGSPGVVVSSFGDRHSIAPAGGGPTLPDVTNYVGQFVVLAEYDDYLLCTQFIQPVNETTGFWQQQLYDVALGQGSLVVFYVAKPYVLQKTPWAGKKVLVNGLSYHYAYTSLSKRTATHYIHVYGGSYVQPVPTVERLAPNYFSGDIITAVRSATGLQDSAHNPVVWCDLNTAGRRWQRDSQFPMAHSQIAVATQTVAAGPEVKLQFVEGSYVNYGGTDTFTEGLNGLEPRGIGIGCLLLLWSGGSGTVQARLDVQGIGFGGTSAQVTCPASANGLNLPYSYASFGDIQVMSFWISLTGSGALAIPRGYFPDQYGSQTFIPGGSHLWQQMAPLVDFGAYPPGSYVDADVNDDGSWTPLPPP